MYDNDYNKKPVPFLSVFKISKFRLQTYFILGYLNISVMDMHVKFLTSTQKNSNEEV